MKHILLIGLLSLFVLKVTGQISYDAASIPKDLLPYAGSVVRSNNITVEVKDLNNIVEHYKNAITVLNKTGDDDAELTIYYNKANHIKSIKGIVYDEFGKPISKISEKDFRDYSAADNASLFEDIREKYYKPSVVSYPYTVEYDYEVLSKQSLNFPDWFPAEDVGIAVQNSSYTFTCPSNFNIHYKERNCPTQANITTNASGQKVYTWTISNLKARRSEPYSPNPEEYLPVVKIAPEKFTYDGHSGSFTNWNELGKWQYDDLLKSRSTLPQATIGYIHQLTDTISDPKRKAKVIYEYMQSKTRYVSVQVGIGGYQPFPAADVDRLGYGDCKALVNYTQALLKAGNINSYYCIVQAGSAKKSLLTDFASMQGNHIILCLPFKNDTTWLECTSQKIPFGFLSDFTDDRWVLACTDAGGRLMHTPKYTAEQNKQIRTAILELKANGELAGNMNTFFEGTQYENRPDEASDNDKDLKMVKEVYPINNLEIESLSFKQVKNIQPTNQEQLKFNARDFATQSGGKLYFMVNPVNRVNNVPREVRNRTTNLYINRGYTDVDEITYTIPEGYKLDIEPLNVTLSKPFGRFKATAQLNANHQLIYKRSLQVIDGTYSKESYQDLVSFYQAVSDADHYNVALTKTN
ncbi:DUF3857 domain-containing protein [Mucilaginibacter robiniae]|uniref:DUF3857 domain-containing protein n=1 Tax=Mucilaginibacter robiniae TaxID=2728022 RepID=A0A7L5DVR4_9SPHI|nr:DUF3857 domain-containing protein [Mucilaginibacter robiniae]QJD94821.1 DUF3857 domain-containing protein [Mucilaginibacter robiniae]